MLNNYKDPNALPGTLNAAAKGDALAKGSCGKLKRYNVPDKTCAMLMAIVADKLETPLNELRFISIKEIAD